MSDAAQVLVRTVVVLGYLALAVAGDYPLCGRNEILSPTPVCCEPTCTDDCSTVKLPEVYVNQPVCVCKPGYVRNNGRCIRKICCPRDNTGCTNVQPTVLPYPYPTIKCPNCNNTPKPYSPCSCQQSPIKPAPSIYVPSYAPTPYIPQIPSYDMTTTSTPAPYTYAQAATFPDSLDFDNLCDDDDECPTPTVQPPCDTTTPPPCTTTTPVPCTTTPVPCTTTPVPYTTSPTPCTTTPAPYTTTPVPYTTTPVPCTTTPAPCTTTPAPCTPTPTPCRGPPTRRTRPPFPTCGPPVPSGTTPSCAPQCGELQTLSFCRPCCVPTCENDCSAVRCPKICIAELNCVCLAGYVLHEGKCIRKEDCPPADCDYPTDDYRTGYTPLPNQPSGCDFDCDYDYAD